MSSALNAAKRVVRVLTAPLPFATKQALLQAERGVKSDLAIPIGELTAWISASTGRIDYFTLYGSVIDRHFSCDVADAAVLDIGAHKGYFALRSFADGAGRVDSYEPESQNLESLNRSAHGRSNWRVFPTAVGASAGTVTLHLAPGSWAHSVHTPVGGESVGTETVEMVALSDALARIGEAGLPVVVKINVEGAAGSMILGTVRDDWARVRLLWIDVEVNDPVGFPEIVGHLADCGLSHVRNDGQRHMFARS